MAGKLAVVTGSNKGIGFATVRELLKRGIETVYLTSRDPKNGAEAVEKLKRLGYNPKFYQLEVTDKESVKRFGDYLKQKYGGLDILVNNAGVVESDHFKLDYEEAKRVINTNFFSLLTIQEYLYPLLRENARVVHIASDCGHISNLENKYWIKRLTKEDLTLEDVKAFIDWFLDSIKNGSFNDKDWCSTNVAAYKVSKIAVCALTRVQQKAVGKNISINCLHPGLVQTDMTKNIGHVTMEQAGEAPAYLALDVDQTVKGKYFWYDKTEKDWADHNLKLHFNRDDIVEFLVKHDFYKKVTAST